MVQERVPSAGKNVGVCATAACLRDLAGPRGRRLEAALARVDTVDALLRTHVDFLSTCLKECMLTSERLIKSIEKLLTTCNTFALYTAHFTKGITPAVTTMEPDEEHQASEKRWHFFSKIDKNFDRWFTNHLDCVQYYTSSENGALLPLVTRLLSIKSASPVV